MNGWVRIEYNYRTHDHFLGVTGRPADEFDRLAVTVTSDAEFLEFLQALAADDELADWESTIEDYLDTLLAWLRSDEGRRRMAAYPSDFSAMAAAIYAGINRKRPPG